MKVKHLLITAFIFFAFLANSFAQYSDETVELSNYNDAGEYFVSYFNDGINLAKAPFKWQKKDWILAATTVTVGSLIYIYDDDIRDVFQNNQSNFGHNLSKHVIEPFGSGRYSIPLLGALYLYGTIDDNDKSKRLALDGVKTFALAATSAVFFKYIFKRHRPFHDVDANPRLWEGPFGSSKYTAFPSAHTAVSFALASYISSAYKEKLWVGITSYSIASLVGLSRIYDDKHWASDVFVGAVLGYAVGKCVFKNSLKEKNIQIIPMSNTGPGITLIKRL